MRVQVLIHAYKRNQSLALRHAMGLSQIKGVTLRKTSAISTPIYKAKAIELSRQS